MIFPKLLQAARLAVNVALVVLAQGAFVGSPIGLCLQVGIGHHIIERTDNAQTPDVSDGDVEVTS